MQSCTETLSARAIDIASLPPAVSRSPPGSTEGEVIAEIGSPTKLILRDLTANGGRVPSPKGFCYRTSDTREVMPTPLPFLISVPHCGLEVPAEVVDLIALEPEDIARYADPETGTLYDFGGSVAARIATRVSRMVVDVNRPPYHLPPRHPDGAVKTRASDGRFVYRGGGPPPIEVVHGLMLRHYFPFHDAVDRLIDECNIRCAFDCHTMDPIGPPLAKDAGQLRPHVCLGNHGGPTGAARRGMLTTCPPAWIRILAEHFRARFPDGDVAINRPFQGGFTPMGHYWRRGIPWMAIELNRGLYEGPDGTVDDGAVTDLRERCWDALSAFWEEVPAADGS